MPASPGAEQPGRAIGTAGRTVAHGEHVHHFGNVVDVLAGREMGMRYPGFLAMQPMRGTGLPVLG